MTELAPGRVPFRDALRYWLRLGFISFGGPAGQIAIMHRELVEQRRWISERRFLHALNYCMVLPGPEAQQLATYIGWLLHGTKGGIAAGALFVLPSFFILVALSWVYVTLGDVPAVAGALYGIKPAVTAIVAYAAWRIGRRAIRGALPATLAVLAFVAMALHAPFPAVIAGAAVVGFLARRHLPAMAGGHGGARQSYGPALIGDTTPPPPYARPSPGRLARVIALGVLLWAVPFALLVITWGLAALPAQMGWFFTKAALLTFGGAYAVLPYVYAAAVGYGWLAPAQMIDGLALGETTPGPLIMVVTFVGFVGGWQHALPAGEPWATALLGAAIATYFTFLPSFLFIFAGAPLVEATHGELRLTGPLTAITAAVVGVIVSLAAFFAVHVFWPQGLDARPDVVAMLIGAAAAVALFRYDAGIVRTIVACALLGLGTTLPG